VPRPTPHWPGGRRGQVCALIAESKTCGLAKHWHAFCWRLKMRRKKLKPPARHIKVSGRHKFMLACNFPTPAHITASYTYLCTGEGEVGMGVEKGLRRKDEFIFCVAYFAASAALLLKLPPKLEGNSIQLGFACATRCTER